MSRNSGNAVFAHQTHECVPQLSTVWLVKNLQIYDLLQIYYLKLVERTAYRADLVSTVWTGFEGAAGGGLGFSGWYTKRTINSLALSRLICYDEFAGTFLFRFCVFGHSKFFCFDLFSDHFPTETVFNQLFLRYNKRRNAYERNRGQTQLQGHPVPDGVPGKENDVSFIIEDVMNLYEGQSSWILRPLC